MSDSTPILPAHIEETIQAIARLHAEHRNNATSLQRAVERATALIGRPAFIGGLTVVIATWILANLLLARLGLRVPDAPPFNWLQSATSILALFITILILSTQRRENELSELRAQLNLEIVITSEQKTAKAIQLLEELRRDLPIVRNRVDAEAAAMAAPAQPEVMLELIKETQQIGEGAVTEPEAIAADPEPLALVPQTIATS